MIILASKSPRRAELIARITEDVQILDSGFEESTVQDSTPKALCKSLSKGKAQAVAAAYPKDIVIGCDTVVALGRRVYGKPHDRAEAISTLSALSGKTHRVFTGVCLQKGKVCRQFVVTTKVRFREIPIEELVRYTQTEEPYDKAGGYGIQGAGSQFVEDVRGSYTNVIGLPVARLRKELSKLI